MLRVIAVIGAAALLSTSAAKHESNAGAPNVDAAPIDVTALLAAAHGAPPMICALAAQSVRNMGGYGGHDAPAPPLGRPLNDNSAGSFDALPARAVGELLDSLSSADACVRELAVRVIGRQDSAVVAAPLVAKLGASDEKLRSVAALGLGLVYPASAVNALVHVTRDASADVRANAVWALGRIDDGRALGTITSLLGDQSPIVREAAVIATGRIDSVTSSAALANVLGA